MPLSCSYLGTPNGVLKVLHLIFGGASLILVATSYVSNWTLDIFIITVAVCFVLSLVYLIVLATIVDLFASKANRIISCIYHIASGTFLIAAAIDLIGWSDYDINCGFDCPNIYNIGVAKILTFINGTLYGIHGFLEIKDDDEDFNGESIALLTIISDENSIKARHHRQQQYYHQKQHKEPEAHCSKEMFTFRSNVSNPINS